MEAVDQPYTLGPQPVAGFMPDQFAAFQNVQNMQGMTDPYFQQATGYANQSAGPISDSQVANYLNPYANYVLGNLNEVFGQQQRNTTGQLTQAAGGLGADRIALGQGELGRQQGLAAGQTMSGIYQQALNAAQNEMQRKQGSAYLLANMGPAAQNARLQAIQAQLGVGGMQQQLEQQKQNALYAQQQAQFAYPFQKNQYLAGLVGGMGPALGYTQTGQSVTTPPTPSTLSQIMGGLAGGAGIGMALANSDVFGGGPTANNVSGSDITNMGDADLSGTNWNLSYRHGGGIPRRAFGGQSGTFLGDNPFNYAPIPDIDLKPMPVPKLAPMQQPAQKKDDSNPLGQILGTAAKILPFFLARGGGVYGKYLNKAMGGGVGPYSAFQPYQGGGGIDDDFTMFGDADFDEAAGYGFAPPMGGRTFSDRFNDAYRDDDPFETGTTPVPFARMSENPALGGTMLADRLAGASQLPAPTPFTQLGADRGAYARAATLQPIVEAGSLGLNQKPNWGTGQAQSPSLVQSGARPADVDAADEPYTPSPRYVQVANPAATTDVSGSPVRRVTAGDGYDRILRKYPEYPGATGQMPTDQLPYPQARDRGVGYQISRSPWLALARAGFATMAGTSPYAGINIGRGALEGVKQLEEQREALMKEEEVNHRARSLWQQAQHHADQYKYLTANQRADVETRAEAQRIAEEKDAYFPPERNWDGSSIVMLPKKPGYPPREFKQGPDGTWQEVGRGQAPSIARPTPPAIPAPPPAVQPQPPVQTQPPAQPQPTQPQPQPQPQPSQSSVAPVGGSVVTATPQDMLNPPVKAERNPSLGAVYADPKRRQSGATTAELESRKLSKETQTANTLDQRATQIGRNLDVVTNWTRSLDPKVNQNASLLKTIFDPGADGEQRMAAITRYNTYAANTGLPQVPKDVMAAMVAMQKDAVLGGFRNITAEGLSAREAQPIIRAAMGVMPGMNTPESASRLLIAGMQQTAQAQRDKQAFFSDYRAKNGGFSEGWEEAFNKSHPPDLYVARTVMSVLPPEAKAALPANVQALRQARDALIMAERSGDQKAVAAARSRYEMGKANFDNKFGNLGNYFMFGRF